MLQWVIAMLVLGSWMPPLAVAGQENNTAVVDEGQPLYETHCALCHQESGEGNSPTFPALTGNSQLGDMTHLVTQIRQGQGTMPPFPDLTAEEISSLASYVRTSWGNEFGRVTTGDVALVLEGLESVGPTASVWDGVFTEVQAMRGQSVYEGACALCHGRRLNGAPDDPDMVATPPLARAPFLRKWDGRSLATLFEYTRATMPEDNPGSLTDEEYVDVIAYMLSVSGMPAGDDALGADRLARAAIQQER